MPRDPSIYKKEGVSPSVVAFPGRRTHITFLLGFVPSLLYVLAVPLSPSVPCGPVLASRIWAGQACCRRGGRRATRKMGVLAIFILRLCESIAALEFGICDSRSVQDKE